MQLVLCLWALLFYTSLKCSFANETSTVGDIGRNEKTRRFPAYKDSDQFRQRKYNITFSDTTSNTDGTLQTTIPTYFKQTSEDTSSSHRSGKIKKLKFKRMWQDGSEIKISNITNTTTTTTQAPVLSENTKNKSNLSSESTNLRNKSYSSAEPLARDRYRNQRVSLFKNFVEDDSRVLLIPSNRTNKRRRLPANTVSVSTSTEPSADPFLQIISRDKLVPMFDFGRKISSRISGTNSLETSSESRIQILKSTTSADEDLVHEDMDVTKDRKIVENNNPQAIYQRFSTKDTPLRQITTPKNAIFNISSSCIIPRANRRLSNRNQNGTLCILTYNQAQNVSRNTSRRYENFRTFKKSEATTRTLPLETRIFSTLVVTSVSVRNDSKVVTERPSTIHPTPELNLHIKESVPSKNSKEEYRRTESTQLNQTTYEEPIQSVISSTESVEKINPVFFDKSTKLTPEIGDFVTEVQKITSSTMSVLVENATAVSVESFPSDSTPGTQYLMDIPENETLRSSDIFVTPDLWGLVNTTASNTSIDSDTDSNNTELKNSSGFFTLFTEESGSNLPTDENAKPSSNVKNFINIRRPSESASVGYEAGFHIITYVLIGLGIIPMVVGVFVVTKFLMNRNKQQIFEGSEYSSEYNRSPLEIHAGVTSSPVATKLPRINHHMFQPSWEVERQACSLSLPSSNSKWEFPRDKLRLQTILGQGNFGQVWKAEADDISGHEGLTRLVAVKMVKEISSVREKEDLLRELLIMQQLGSHPNVVTLLGCCTDKEPYMLIMEYVMYGKLLTFLRDQRTRSHYFNFSDSGGDMLTSRDLTVFAYCVARGMEYLVSKQIVHRDLAARNILVDHNKLCKIADFGMSRHVGESGVIFEHRQSKGALPIRWMAPESLHYSLYNYKTDVWSFGILMWEIVTLGLMPYSNMGARVVMRKVKEGYRLEKPKHCRSQLFNIISKCWYENADKRPTFTELKQELSDLLEDENHQGNLVDLDSLIDEMSETAQNDGHTNRIVS